MPFELADFYNETRNARKLIVVELGYLGDSIHLIPTLAELKRQYPHAELHVASAPVGSELLALAPCVDRTWPLPRSPGGTPWRMQWAWIRAVRREKFDVAFNFSGTDRTLFLSYLTGAPYRVAYAGGGRDHFWSRWLIRNWVPRTDRSVPLAEQRRGVLAACGMAVGPIEYPLRIPEADLRWAESQVPSGALHFSLNAGHPLKEWPLPDWIALGQEWLRECADPILVTGTRHPRERARIEQFAQALPNKRVQVFPGNLSLAQFAALLARCRLHVGADSGALHLATVLGVKTVSLFREYTGIGEWLPRGMRHRSVVAPCRCVNQNVQPCAGSNRPECLAGIPVATVSALIRELTEESS